MKKIVYLLIAAFSISSLMAQTTGPIQFNEVKHSFGKVKQGVPVTYVFSFKNSSDKPVVIESAVAGCGCTTPEYNKGAIAPGASDKIKVTYNAAAMGTFTKQVTVKLANVTDPIVLNIEGEVVESASIANSKIAQSSTVSAKPKAKAAPVKAKAKP